MGLNRLDFLSNAPKNFIFRNTSNKTNFGGVLFLLYIFIVVLIIIFYLCKFYTDEDYSVEYIYNEEPISKDEAKLKLNDNKYNPYFDFIFEFLYVDKTSKKYILLPDDFVLINTTNNQTIPLNTTLKIKVSDINIKIAVKYEDNIFDSYDYLKDFIILMCYNGFALDHQNSSLPLYQLNNKWLVDEMNFQNDNPKSSIFNYRVVKYKADTGFLKLWNKLINKKDEESQKIIGLKYNSEDNYFTDDFLPYEETNFTINGTEYKGLGDINTYLDYDHYEEYKRTKKSILDTISNICSLSLTIFNVLSVCINFYSQNFNNYKIIEKILENKNTIKIKNTKYDLNNDTNKKDSLLEKNDDKNNLCINDEDTDKLDEENNKENNDNYNNINEEQNKNRNLPKLTFFDYFFNYIYCEKCCKIRKQKIISKCNEIISKYYSIENIIYNQILLENLFKDYKRINKGIMTYENNELIIQLNDLVSNLEKT